MSVIIVHQLQKSGSLKMFEKKIKKKKKKISKDNIAMWSAATGMLQ